jgi:hypothetical protein
MKVKVREALYDRRINTSTDAFLRSHLRGLQTPPGDGKQLTGKSIMGAARILWGELGLFLLVALEYSKQKNNSFFSVLIFPPKFGVTGPMPGLPFFHPAGAH